MRLVLTAIACALLAACTTIQTRAGGAASFPAADRASAYRIATEAALAAGFTLTSSDSATGLIVATRGSNRALTWDNPTINIMLSWASGAGALRMTSTVGGQILDYGTTASTMQDYCTALLSLQPSASCAVNPS